MKNDKADCNEKGNARDEKQKKKVNLVVLG